MQVYKFGGASVRDAEGVRRLADIVRSAPRPLVVVVSAMGKTTDALERVTYAFYRHRGDLSGFVAQVKEYHLSIVRELFPPADPAVGQVSALFAQLEQALRGQPSFNYDFDYDRIVCFGELLSTVIVAAYLNRAGIKIKWLDVRRLIKTDSTYRDARVDWDLTLYNIRSMPLEPDTVYLTQGFIASDRNGQTTTLGREGSDFSAAIFAWALGAESLTVWKDVDGIYNADPKRFAGAQKFQRLSYRETIELAFYGAKVIHPKTIKPLSQKKIPLYVRSFLDTKAEGTVIDDFEEGLQPHMPVIIVKDNQVLVSVSLPDYGFIAENGLQRIFAALDRYRLKANVMQRSALQFSLSVDNDRAHLPAFLDELSRNFRVKYNTGLTLYTIRHYDEQTVKKVTAGRQVFLHQQSRTMSFYLVKD